ncbi:cytochrome c oxidase assembly protein [Luteibacter jiangsuensis]|uniref:Cytochrome c oxidase assembly protein n=1 Tax=Luteibacter jiangsuensis TaxID=637577 RepID=A0ABX0Q723_9GAMM|nr:cytochrome c oxidase assembly protein [Luteibacter jiangsuensis]NID05427.1 cytochrome c oxidase assembly protein [Luteibacter jiangsuensis]
MLDGLLKWIVPWEFSWVFLLTFVGVAWLYVRGTRRLRVPFGRQVAFWVGMSMVYVSLHTYFDYFAEHEFFMHRIQQVLLHHLAPLLLIAAYPGTALRAGLPLAWRVHVRRAGQSMAWRVFASAAFNPAFVTLFFVALILVWLIPDMQTLAMLDWRIYRAMNWSMVLSGLSYWWLVLDHRPKPPGRMSPGWRVLSPAITMTPQIVAGAIVTFSKTDLYPIFEICGRAFTMNVLTGQLIGGVIMWVPAAMIESIGGLLALQQWLRLSRRRPVRAAMAARSQQRREAVRRVSSPL